MTSKKMKEEEKEPAVLVAMRVADAPARSVAPGSDPVGVCQACGAACWLTKESQRILVSDMRIKTTCVPCASRDPKFKSDTISNPDTMLSDEQYATLVEWFKGRGMRVPSKEELIKVALRRLGRLG